MRNMRLVLWMIVALTLIVAFIVARPDDDDGDAAGDTTALTSTEPVAQPAEPMTETTETETTETETETAPAAPQPVRLIVRVQDGRPAGGIVRGQAEQGEPVLLVVRSDVADHVHVHGYDLMADVGPGRPARMQFRANLTGRFEIELEDRAQQIAQLTVVP